MFLLFVTKSRLTLCNPWTIARQAPLSMEFSRQEYWGGFSFPSPGDLPDLGIKPTSPVAPALQVDSFLLSSRGNMAQPNQNTKAKILQWVFISFSRGSS